MKLASITLNSGRRVTLGSLEISSTYGGLLAGYPCARLNDRKLARLAKRPESDHPTCPVHLITPPRRYPEGKSGGRRPFGPVEELPALYCRGVFTSHCVTPNPDGAFDGSWLTVIWFQDDLATPVPDFAATAIADLAWDELAEDYEL
ncbi:hypothetical protein [Actinomadura oligospora]|uniref:hypothetical protein n=1 Tax=Actinomadura oligospora TaxID=111804 RepID=UPI00047EB536|nr:hypothetical protein [Actinomadura oligospora]